MSNDTEQLESPPKNPGREKVLALYSYLKELSNLRSTKIVDIEKHQNQTPSPYLFYLDELPRYLDYVEINWRDTYGKDKESEGTNSSDYLLKVRKPDFQKCPTPPRKLIPWLIDGWDDRKCKTTKVYPGKLTNENGEFEYLPLGYTTPTPTPRNIELFENEQERVTSYSEWVEARKIWFEDQRKIESVQNLFVKLYTMRSDLDRESETYEVMIGTGFVVLKQNPDVNHPILLQKVAVRFEADSNTISIEDTDDDAELYVAPLQESEGLALASLQSFEKKITDDCIHPLDRNNTPLFLKELAHTLTPKGEYSDQPSKRPSDPSVELLIYNKTALFMRKMVDGTARAIERVMDDVEDGGQIPGHLLKIVEGGEVAAPNYEAKSIESRLAEVGGESKEILLAKQANREQLEIARRIEQFDAVLVQGPPGTGKTHTIANLMGHFLAQGKSVLVTSKTAKALNVLKDKLPRGVQDLCVSVLDGTNKDMENSVDGITEYSAHNTSSQMAAKAHQLSEERDRIINELASTRKRLFDALNEEYESITICGESISPADAACFVADNKERLEGVIPGPVDPRAPFPLLPDELRELYRSNLGLENEEETEISKNLPDITTVMDPADFREICLHKSSTEKAIHELLEKNSWTISNKNGYLSITSENGCLLIDSNELQKIENFKEIPHKGKTDAPWFKPIAAMGRNGGAISNRWETLFDQIRTTTNASEHYLDAGFGFEVVYDNSIGLEELEEILEATGERLEKYGTLEPRKKRGLLARFRNEKTPDFSVIRVNGHLIDDSNSLVAAKAKIAEDKEKIRCRNLWNQQAAPCGLPLFDELDSEAPHIAAQRWIPVIEETLAWYEDSLPSILESAEKQIPGISKLLNEDPLRNDQETVTNAIHFTEVFLPEMLRLASLLQDALLAKKTLHDLTKTLMEGLRSTSNICNELVNSIESTNQLSYETAYNKLQETIAKEEPLRRRRELLNRIEKVAPEWAASIEERKAPHDSATPPAEMKDAWRWCQYNGIIEEINSAPISKLQHDATDLANSYREKTAQLAEAKAWEHLLRKTECDVSLKQNLQGWKETIKKIGKGTGKRAPRLRKEARRLMASCQDAVPAWIMPTSKALSTLDPRRNRFDVVIIDEASQSDVTSLAIAYLAKKLIVVGDDKQVSPVAVGVDIDKEDALADIYLKNNGIPNAHLYGSKLSLYDVALQTFQPLMLKEHFRCVPDIIGYSNMLSYDYRIKPLRDASSSNLLPAVVPYRAENAFRDQRRKINQGEAEEIARLIKACVAEPEYNGKTFGIISMLGTEQVKVLQQIIFRELEPKLREERKILIGDAANFQGDERDVIFLSMVDSPKTPGFPMTLTATGADDRTKKRYNVAASRAKDQLWVIYSMDPGSELKAGDIRKSLIDYARDPKTFQRKAEEIEAKAESPFEAEVGKAIVARGYKITQQWEVGAYRIDMVVYDNNGRVAVECDGERWHSGEEAIYADMERQAILERLGWRFIRIRGSEYYRDPEKTIDRVLKELTEFSIKPIGETPELDLDSRPKENDLLERVKRNVQKIKNDDPRTDELTDYQRTIEAALSSAPSEVNSCRGGIRFVTDEELQSFCERGIPEDSTEHVSTLRTTTEGDPTETEDEFASTSNLANQAESHIGHIKIFPSSVQEAKYEKASVPHVTLTSEDYTGGMYSKRIAEHMSEILSTEAPISKKKLFNDTRDSFGIKRSGSGIQNRNQAVLDRKIPHKTTSWNESEWIWKPDQNPDTYAIYRPNTTSNERESNELPYEEIRSSILATIGRRKRIKKTDLAKESAQRFGYANIRSRLMETFSRAIERMTEEGLLLDDDYGYVRYNYKQR